MTRESEDPGGCLLKTPTHMPAQEDSGRRDGVVIGGSVLTQYKGSCPGRSR